MLKQYFVKMPLILRKIRIWRYNTKVISDILKERSLEILSECLPIICREVPKIFTMYAKLAKCYEDDSSSVRLVS